MTCLAALGDSFSAGVSGRVDEVVWVRLVADRLQARGAEVRLEIYARHGATSDEVIAEQLPEVLRDGADAITLTCGANDVLRNAAPDLDRFAENFELLLDGAARALGARVVASTYPDFSSFLPYRPLSKSRVVDGMAEVNVRIRRLAARHRALCVDIERDLAPDPECFAADGLHLSAVGHRRTAELVLAALGPTSEEQVTEMLLSQWW
jgi:lysophospholipase L1-like esterase